jgi:drug/metabolite transporter (DMT)-like permease
MNVIRFIHAGPVKDSPIRGMIFMAIAMLILPGIDVFAKLLGQDMSPGQVVWYRFFLQSMLITPIIIYNRLWHLPSGTLLIQFMRGVLLAAATLFFFAALNYLSIAAAISIFFVEPMILTLLSVFFLGEVIRIRRILAIIIGFSGALLVIRPSFVSVGLPALLPLATAVTFAFYLLLTRRISGTVNPFQMQWMVGISAVFVMSIALICGESFGIVPIKPSLPEGHAVLFVLGLGFFSTIGHLLIVFAMRRAPASLLAPFQYIEILGATVFGYLVFGNLLDLESVIGVLIIIASGLYLFHRESLSRS